jgi:hypothetical protein
MNGLGAFIFLCIMLMFGVPVIIFIVGLVKWRTKRNTAKNLFILAAVWLIIGGGICASLLMG